MFLSRAWADDPLISMSLLPKKALLDQLELQVETSDSDKPSTSRPGPQPYPQLNLLEDITKPNSTATSPLEPEELDLDLPSSVTEELEIEVCSCISI
jgi:hypothetical protein